MGGDDMLQAEHYWNTFWRKLSDLFFLVHQYQVKEGASSYATQ